MSPGVQSINGVPGPFTFGTGSTCVGTLCTFSGGASLPSATVPGQIIAASNPAGTTYTAQGALYFEQPADTITSIETQCSSPCTEVVTQPFTQTIAANHTLNPNVNLQFQGNGSWTVNGTGFTLTIGGQVAGTIAQHFIAGTASIAFSSYNTLVPVEWFGAVGDWNGTTGTNNLTAIQTALNATTYGQIFYSAKQYAIGGTLTVTKGNLGMKGPRAGRGGDFGLVETVAGDDAVDITGGQGYFEDFAVESSVTQTGTASGLHFSGSEGALIKNVMSQDFFYPFYIHNSPSGAAGWFNDQAQFTALSSTLTSPVGYYMPSTDGLAEDSLTIRDSSMTTTPTGGPLSAIGAEMYGTAVNDVDLFNFNVAGGNGILIDYTGTGSGAACSDKRKHIYLRPLRAQWISSNNGYNLWKSRRQGSTHSAISTLPCWMLSAYH